MKRIEMKTSDECLRAADLSPAPSGQHPILDLSIASPLWSGASEGSKIHKNQSMKKAQDCPRDKRLLDGRVEGLSLLRSPPYRPDWPEQRACCQGSFKRDSRHDDSNPRKQMSYLCCADIAESGVPGGSRAAPLVDPHLASLSLIEGLAPFDSTAQLGRPKRAQGCAKVFPGFSDFHHSHDVSTIPLPVYFSSAGPATTKGCPIRELALAFRQKFKAGFSLAILVCGYERHRRTKHQAASFQSENSVCETSRLVAEVSPVSIGNRACDKQDIVRRRDIAMQNRTLCNEAWLSYLSRGAMTELIPLQNVPVRQGECRNET